MPRTLLCMLLAAAFAAPANAEGDTKERRRKTRSERPHRVAPEPVSESRAKRNSATTAKRIRWSSSLAELRERAAAKGKMMLWMQMVGDLEGGL